MDSKYKLVCLDSSVFIGKLKGEICNGIKRDVIFDQIWRNAVDGKIKVCTSVLTIAEVFKPRFKQCDTAVDLADSHCQEFLDLIEVDFLDVIEIDRETALLAHALCRKYIVAPNDGLQLACAIQAKCDAFLAWDRPLIGKKNDHISIETPSMFNPTLFENNTDVASKEEIEEYEKHNPRPLKKIAANAPVASKTDGKSNGKTIKTTEKSEVVQEVKRPDA